MTAHTKASSDLAGGNTLNEAKILLQKGRLADAVKSFEHLLNSEQSNREALYYLAVSHRKNNNNDKAFATLEQLESLHPRYGRAFQEKGHNFLSINQPAEALTAFEQAVDLNPAMPASWKALASLYERSGNTEASKQAAQHVAWLSSLPAQLLTVTSLIHENKLFKAEQLCRDFLLKHPHHIEAMRLLAELGMKLQILDDAEYLLESCVEFSPNHQRARLDYVQVLHKRQKFKKALEQAEILHANHPENLSFEITLATEKQAVGDFDDALKIYDNLLKREQPMPSIHSARGHALKTIGRTEDAVASYRAAYAAKQDFGDAFWSLANLKTYRFSDAEMAQMRAAESAPTTSETDRIHLCFALGKALEDRTEFANSFSYYERGNALKKQRSRYSPKRLEAEMNAQKEQFDATFFAARSGQGCPSTAPIFVVGLPRAGSTLLEQILASHSKVEGTMELANILGLAHRLNGRRRIKDDSRYPKIVHQLSAEQVRKFGEDYIADTAFHRHGGEYFIDKMPNNFKHIGLIHLILPNAKIIDARRHPMSCCFSGFKQLFAEGQEFTYGLEEMGRYYRACVELMEYWDTVLPGKILRVQYEDVVSDLETEVRRILEFCELPFEPECLEFYHTKRAVRTPSSEQVRQPIYTSGLEQWRNFEPYLEPLKAALGPALNRAVRD